MKRWLPLAAVFVIAVLAAHLAVLKLAPEVIMGKAMSMMAERGVPLHRFVMTPRVTPQTQTIVRPSPDLAYSTCRFDFGSGIAALNVHMAAWTDYASLSLFDARTDNFAGVRGRGRGATVRLLPPGSAATGPGTIIAPSARGVILIRRLAPSEDAYRRVVAIAGDDRCDALPKKATAG